MDLEMAATWRRSCMRDVAGKVQSSITSRHRSSHSKTAS
jgi:hypothetical protein